MHQTSIFFFFSIASIIVFAANFINSTPTNNTYYLKDGELLQLYE